MLLPFQDLKTLIQSVSAMRAEENCSGELAGQHQTQRNNKPELHNNAQDADHPTVDIPPHPAGGGKLGRAAQGPR